MTQPFPNNTTPLNVQEKTLLDRLARGWSCRSIAKTLEIGDTTFSIMVRVIKAKLNAHTKSQAVAIAITRQWIYPFDTKIPYPKDGVRPGDDE
jgi:DNA-binding NarL/FixJ family response regulator